MIQEEKKGEIDYDAHSRQIATFGVEAHSRLMKMKVFVSGINGLGIQVVKNLVLAGPNEVVIHDNELVTVRDVGRNFYAQESHIGKMTRADVSLAELQKMNPNIKISVSKDASIDYICSNFNFVAMLDNYDQDYLIELNKRCREKNIGFLLAGNLGLYGYTFVDFGDQHEVFDATGEQEIINHVKIITKGQEGEVSMHDEQPHQLSDGDCVTFREVKGMSEVNGKTFKIKVKNQFIFTIGDTSNFSDYESGGIATQVKVPEFLKFKSFEESLVNPFAPSSNELPICSWEKFGYPQKLHLILRNLYQYWKSHNKLPKEEEISQIKKAIAEDKACLMEDSQYRIDGQVEDKLIENIVRYAQCQISPVCSFWGGIIAQEIVKFTGKFTPIRQWLHHQFLEMLPEEDSIKRSHLNSRYGDYNALFGDQFTEKAASTNSFLIGAGALGCEFIKMFSLMGLSTHQKSSTLCTDDDNIEISNLNRQFLFRREHVKKNKSEIACHAGKKINPHFNIESVKLKACPETEDVFTDSFWQGLDFVVNAVDNINARKYLDRKCVWYEKPLFESGTLGTKCHSQIILPHKTLTYNDIRDPPQKQFASCTVKNAPYLIEHTIQWARQYFEGAFAEPSNDLLKLFEEKEQFLLSIVNQNKANPSISKNKLSKLREFYYLNQSKSFEKCVEMAVNIFYDCFYYQIGDLLECFPVDAIDKDTGKLFWSETKRAPTIISLNLSDPIHLELIQACSNILATILGLKMQLDREIIRKIAGKVEPRRLDSSGKKGKMSFDEKEGNSQSPEYSADDEVEVSRMYEELKMVALNSELAPLPVAFEKDDPANWHIEFMGGVSNLRARNYQIEEADNFKIKIIAGKIIPAIATTTAMVVGAVGIEIIKYILNKDISAFKNITSNLALPLWVFNDPQPPIQIKDKTYDEIMGGPIVTRPSKFTCWDKIHFKSPTNVKEMIDNLEKTYGFSLTMINYGNGSLYWTYRKQSKKILDMKIEDAIALIFKEPLNPKNKLVRLEVCGEDEKGIDCILPEICYHLE